MNDIHKQIEAAKRHTQECMEHLDRFDEHIKEALQDALKVMKAVRAILTDADDIEELDVRIAETRARLADLEDN